MWVPTPGKLGEHGRKGKLVGWDEKNVSHIIFFPATRNAPLSLRTSRHIAIKDKRLPDAVLKGDVGMVFPEFKPFSEDDDVEVEIIDDRNNRTTKNSQKRPDNVNINTKSTEVQDARKRNSNGSYRSQWSQRRCSVGGGASAPTPMYGTKWGRVPRLPAMILPASARAEDEEFSDTLQLTDGRRERR